MFRKHFRVDNLVKIVSFFVICALVLSFSIHIIKAEDEVVEVSSPEQLSDVVNSMSDSSDIKVKLVADIEYTTSVQVKKGKLTILGEGYTMSFKGPGTGLSVWNNATLSLGESGYSNTLTIEGDKTQDDSLIFVNTATLNMYDSVTMQNGMSSNNASAVQVNNKATFNMYGGLSKTLNILVVQMVRLYLRTGILHLICTMEQLRIVRLKMHRLVQY